MSNLKLFDELRLPELFYWGKNKMENINKLIEYLIAICNFAKDIHYNSKGDAFYGKHLLADRIQENLSEYLDQIKEVFFLPANKEPLPSAEYLTEAAKLIPAISGDDKTDFASLQKLLIITLQIIESIEGLTVGEDNLIGEIAQNLQQSLGLINRQVK